jgi:hypothetical protein
LQVYRRSLYFSGENVVSALGTFSHRFGFWYFQGFMDGCPERALDTHIYQAWRDPDSRLGFFQDACRQKKYIAAMELAFGPVIVGEWSLATDNCAMWLNGFNDNLPGFPRLPCKYTPCAEPYMGTEQPGTPVDPSKPMQGPYGTVRSSLSVCTPNRKKMQMKSVTHKSDLLLLLQGMSGPIFGLCPGSRDWIKEQGNPLTGREWVKVRVSFVLIGMHMYHISPFVVFAGTSGSTKAVRRYRQCHAAFGLEED